MLREDGESSSFIDSRVENCRKESSVPVLREVAERMEKIFLKEKALFVFQCGERIKEFHSSVG